MREEWLDQLHYQTLLSEEGLSLPPPLLSFLFPFDFGIKYWLSNFLFPAIPVSKESGSQTNVREGESSWVEYPCRQSSLSPFNVASFSSDIQGKETKDVSTWNERRDAKRPWKRPWKRRGSQVMRVKRGRRENISSLLTTLLSHSYFWV